MRDRARIVAVAAGIFGAGVLATALVLGVVSARGEPRFALFGASLGMTPSAVRAQFHGPKPGDFAPTSADGALLVMLWRSHAGDVEVRFEVHSGLVVALRAIVPVTLAPAAEPGTRIRNAEVVAIARDGDFWHYTAVARDCPHHVDEVRRLIESSVRSTE